MLKYTSKNLPKHTKEFLVEIDWETINSKQEESFAELTALVTAPGFRKGKAPRDVASQYINPEKIYERIVRKILPEMYKELIDKEKLKPVVSPSVELTEAKANMPWKLTVQVAEIPEVKLKEYKQQISALHKKAIDEKNNTQTDKSTASDDKEIKDPKAKIVAPLSQVFTCLLENAQVEIPDLLINEEVNRRLSQLVEDVRRVGMTVDQYLNSKQTTMDTMKATITKDSDEMYKLEFILAKIAEVENLGVEQTELEAIMANARTDKEKEIAKSNLAWYETLLKKQKVIDFLNNL